MFHLKFQFVQQEVEAYRYYIIVCMDKGMPYVIGQLLLAFYMYMYSTLLVIISTTTHAMLQTSIGRPMSCFSTTSGAIYA